MYAGVMMIQVVQQILVVTVQAVAGDMTPRASLDLRSEGV